VFAIGGMKKEARKELTELKSLREEKYVSAVGIAFIHIGLGEKEEALAWLEKGYEERAFQMQFLKVEPRWNDLRSDPRFIDLIRRMNFPE
jgi:hypothetical protein